jgi:capsular polysaccharide transport system permease protein
MVGFLTIQEFDRRFKTSRFGAFLALAEPILIIAAITAFRALFRGVLPQYGTSTVVFISSGIFPFYVFLRLSTRTRGARYDAVHRLPRATSTETLLAAIAAETALILTSLVLWFIGMWAFGLEEAKPEVPSDCVIALALLAVAGIGVGLVNAAISRRFPLWPFIYAIPSRALMILSGAYYIVDLLPLSFRNVVVWNPLAHGIEWFRLGLYGHYPVLTLDREYFVLGAVMALFLGIAAHRATIRSERV